MPTRRALNPPGPLATITASIPWVLAPACFVHHRGVRAEAGDADLLRRARDAFAELVASGVDASGTVRALLGSFRVLQPFCEAFVYLRDQGALPAAQITAAETQIAASADTHLGSTDWGAQNRATVDAAGFYAAARAVPGHERAARWRGYGDALIEDSWGRWSIEDASIYGPFWLLYLLTAAEAQGRETELLETVTTRYYFEQYQHLLMPNGMLPDWGDGDWTHMWTWYSAVMVRAACAYGRGEYLHFARRLYDTHRAMALAGNEVYGYSVNGLDPGDALYSVATALRWLGEHEAPAPAPYRLECSEEVVEDVLSKKIAFRNAGDGGDTAAFGLLNYRDPGPYGRYQRDYQNQQLFAFEEMPHHGHADENSLVLLMEGGTILLADGGYRRGFHDGWRADVFHNRLVARLGWPNDYDEVMPYLLGNRQYLPVRTEKVHFGTFGCLDYSRTRLVDVDRGYTGDRIVLFLPATGMYVLVDAVRIDREGPKLFANVWHPDNVLATGAGDGERAHWTRSWPERIPIRNEHWTNPHERELLIQFLGNRDRHSQTRTIDRRFNPSTAFFQFLYGYFFAGQRLGFVTVLTPHAPGAFREQMLRSVDIVHDDDGSYRSLGLRLDVGDGAMATVGLKLEQTIGLTNLRGRPMFDWRSGAIDYDGLQTDADFAVVVDRGAQAEIGLMHGSRLCWRGEVLFDMPTSEHMYQGPVDYAVPDRKDKMPRWREIVAKEGATA